MKQLLSIFVLLLLVGSISAQSTDKYRAVSLGFGPRIINTDPGIISTSFTDNSPSMDMFVDDFTVEDSYTKIGVNVGYKWGRYNGLSQSVGLDITAGEHQRGSFYYSIGWTKTIELSNGWLSIRPAIYGGFSNQSFDLGQIENNAGYIQIGETQYYDNYLDISLKTQSGLYGPEIGVVYNSFEFLEFWATASYDLASSNARPKLIFMSPAEEGGTSTLDLEKATSATITYNGEEVTSLPYSTKGLRLTVGLSYVWNRD